MSLLVGGDTGAITIMESPAGACVELVESPKFEVGMYSVGANVNDLGKVLAELEQHACEPISPIAPTTVGRQAFIQDSDGIRLCPIEHSEAYRQKHMA